MLKAYEHLPAEQRLDALRGQELRCAADKLGLTGLHYLGYRDSGMTGSGDKRDPPAFVHSQPGEGNGKIVALIRSVKPQVVVTFDPFGGYGHPDHIFIHHRTTEAFQAAGDPAQFPGTGEPYQPQKLYWSVFSRGILKFLVKLMPLFRRDPRKFGRNGDVDLLEIAKHDYPPPTRIDIRKYYASKQPASRCHPSQFTGGPMRFGKLQKWLASYETFRLVEPNVNGQRRGGRDL